MWVLPEPDEEETVATAAATAVEIVTSAGADAAGDAGTAGATAGDAGALPTLDLLSGEASSFDPPSPARPWVQLVRIRVDGGDAN